MFEVKVAVTKVLGTCTSDVPMKRGDYFLVRDGDVTIPDGGHICLYALQNLLPVITPKERALAEARDEDWMWRVRHVQCPDPKGRVIFTVDQVRRLEKAECSPARVREPARARTRGGERGPSTGDPAVPDAGRPATPGAGGQAATAAVGAPGRVSDLRIVVERVDGRCTSRMRPGDVVTLRGGRLYLPPGRPFCLYALAAVLPLLPAKQRCLDAGDWMATDRHVICPDPAGNAILRIDACDEPGA
jgi:uncharacterized repeat protein (TIGR04076 family)